MMAGVSITIQEVGAILVDPGLEAHLAVPHHSTRVHQYTHKVLPQDVVFLKEFAEHLLRSSSINFQDFQEPHMIHHNLPQVCMIIANQHGEDLQHKSLTHMKHF